jgi:hypothetical protein
MFFEETVTVIGEEFHGLEASADNPRDYIVGFRLVVRDKAMG